ncbi:hypothetical protein DYI37_12715 [Fulvimarina endophytica]|uniref:Alkaline proteinase inhibitor/ Outer membrane lipoprotein Omp19 domain-containing protein n=1 Tax=Fulvimarina endophytica TaxID=2293836 RepID=A0A371X0R9_9HYPH|nr:hypothetical protein [Fulvimarina endophytica]RFC62822.1 hypothetical protein DYI37_12715 [Fulvimarina endophytica]
MKNFVATAACAGLAAVVLVANLQGAPVSAETTRADVTVIDPKTTASLAVPGAQAAPAKALRMIDLRSGATCRIAAPAKTSQDLTRAPVGPECQGSPALSRVAKWRHTPDGSLEMLDEEDETVLLFMPGDGVLYESIYPSEALVTIVSANG